MLLREISWTPEERALTFICGPTAFVEAAANALVQLDTSLVSSGQSDSGRPGLELRSRESRVQGRENLHSIIFTGDW